MDYQAVIGFINEWIVANGNNEITADVLRPILIAMVDQSNDVTGDLGDLNTANSDNLVAAINEVNAALSTVNNNGIKLHTGTGNPNDPGVVPSYNYADFYMQIDLLNVPILLYQYNGLAWVTGSEVNQPNEIISIGAITRVGNTFTIPAGATWRINGTVYTNASAYSTTIAEAAAGYTRVDLLVARADSTFSKVVGVEAIGVADTPQKPNNTVAVIAINIIGTDVQDAPPPSFGDEYISKASKASNIVSGTVVNNMTWNDKTKYTIIAADEIKGISDTYLGTLGYYENQKYSLYNISGSDVIIRHNDAAAEMKFLFPSGVDFTLPNNTTIEFDFVNGNAFSLVGSVSSGGGAVSSVNALTGDVVLNGSNINVTNPVTSTQTDLDTALADIEAQVAEVDQDKILSMDALTVLGNDVTIPDNATWRISGNIYTNSLDVVKTSAFAAAGFNRFDLIVANTSNGFDLVAGTEVDISTSVAVFPAMPANTLLVTAVYVTESEISVDPVLIGNQWVTKESYGAITIAQSTAIDNLPRSQRSTYLIKLCPEIRGIATASTAPSSDTNYTFQEYRIVNLSGSTVTLKHLHASGQIKFIFPDEADFVLPNMAVACFTQYSIYAFYKGGGTVGGSGGDFIPLSGTVDPVTGTVVFENTDESSSTVNVYYDGVNISVPSQSAAISLNSTIAVSETTSGYNNGISVDKDRIAFKNVVAGNGAGISIKMDNITGQSQVLQLPDNANSSVNTIATEEYVDDAIAAAGGGGGGTVDSISVTDGISVDNTNPAIPILGLGDITPSNVTTGGVTASESVTTTKNVIADLAITAGTTITAVGNISGANLTGTNTGDQDISGIATNTASIANNTTQLAIREKYFYYNGIPSTEVIGTTTQTYLSFAKIDANALQNGSSFALDFIVTKAPATATFILKIWHNTSNSLTGATQIGENTGLTATRWVNMHREIIVDGSNISHANASISLVNDTTGNTSGAMGSTAFNTAVDNYFIISVTPTSSSDGFTCRKATIKGIK